jgi:radical SAM enzyme (TIGR01210 family)
LPAEPACAGAAGRRQIKLYNAGSFFDPQAIPPEDDEEIAETVSAFDRVIVESHPAFLAGGHGERCARFRTRLSGRLEVAIGLETAHGGVLARLNKRMTVDSFRRAARFLAEHEIDLRVFVLLNPPFLPAAAGLEWACRSIDVAAEAGATACSIIPTRPTNARAQGLDGAYAPPRLAALEAAVEYGLQSTGLPERLDGVPCGMRVFADLWDVARFFDCACSPARAARLRAMNATQQPSPRVTCHCDTRV